MPKPRTVDAGFFDDPDIANLTRDERLLLIGMISTCADDEGRLMAESGYLRKKVFGYDDDVTRADVQGWRDSVIVKCRNVKLYEVDGQCYIWLVNWKDYQNIRYVIASKLPEYSEECDVMLSNKEGCGKLPQITEDLRAPTRAPARGQGSVGLGRVNVGLGESTPQSAAVPPTPISAEAVRPTAHPIPPDFGITPDMRKKAKGEGWPNWIDVDKHTLYFVEYWTIGEGAGHTKKNWVLTWATWMRSEANKAEARGVRFGGTNGATKQGVGRVQIQKAGAETDEQSYAPGLKRLLEERASEAKGA